ncbi:phytochrome-like protein cph1 [archaeon BMS3Bbin15]|nr:phytochrome-like protein cph1 [archaeon BMS3Bbin15]
MRDITERKHAEEAIKKYAKELEEVNRLKDTFLDIMHHDLLNPLGTAMGYLDLLMDTEDQEIKSELEVVNRNISRAIDLIESATRLSKLQSKNSLELEDINLREIVDRCIENFSYEASKAGMKIENRITQPISVKANKIIEEVFSNLISNAIKYASEGTKVIIEAEEKENSLRIKVKDFGKGIKDSSKQEIFERFRRKEKRSIKGSGLGLAIASRIVELHSGKIWVEDNPEGGAVFVVEIPKK